MQKWRNWEAAGEADWLLALKRESVIGPLAAQAKLGLQRVDEAALGLGLGRSVVYDLVVTLHSIPGIGLLCFQSVSGI